MHTPTTRETIDIRVVAKRVDRMIGVEDVDAAMGIVLRFAVWREDLDGAVNSGGGDGWFVGVACYRQYYSIDMRREGGDTLYNIDNLAIPFEDINQITRLSIPDEHMARVATTHDIFVIQAKETDVLDGLDIAVSAINPSMCIAGGIDFDILPLCSWKPIRSG